jgi:hypothetical protein
VTSLLEEKKARHASPTQSSEGGGELEQVVGNAEDDIGDRLATVRETELLYGENSLLAVYGPMLAHICRNPGRFKVRENLTHLLCNLTNFLLLCVEPNSSRSSGPFAQQIPLRQLPVLRTMASDAVQSVEDFKRPQHS